jgi:hypothetical protein
VVLVVTLREVQVGVETEMETETEAIQAVGREVRMGVMDTRQEVNKTVMVDLDHIKCLKFILFSDLLLKFLNESKICE